MTVIPEYVPLTAFWPVVIVTQGARGRTDRSLIVPAELAGCWIWSPASWPEKYRRDGIQPLPLTTRSSWDAVRDDCRRTRLWPPARLAGRSAVRDRSRAHRDR